MDEKKLNKLLEEGMKRESPGLSIESHNEKAYDLLSRIAQEYGVDLTPNKIKGWIWEQKDG